MSPKADAESSWFTPFTALETAVPGNFGDITAKIVPNNSKSLEMLTDHLRRYLSHQCDGSGSHMTARPSITNITPVNSVAPNVMLLFATSEDSIIHTPPPYMAELETKGATRLTVFGRIDSRHSGPIGSPWVFGEADVWLRTRRDLGSHKS